MPVDHVEAEYKKLLKKATTFPEIDLYNFFHYFEKNFLMSKKYPLESWNAHKRVICGIPLTSNNAEVFNRHFTDRFDQCHPELTTFVEKLKVVQSSIENEIEFSMANPSNDDNKQYKQKIASLKRICQNYQYVENNMLYLEIVAKTYAWKID